MFLWWGGGAYWGSTSPPLEDLNTLMGVGTDKFSQTKRSFSHYDYPRPKIISVNLPSLLEDIFVTSAEKDVKFSSP
jgi:hypothetical protein